MRGHKFLKAKAPANTCEAPRSVSCHHTAILRAWRLAGKYAGARDAQRRPAHPRRGRRGEATVLHSQDTHVSTPVLNLVRQS